MAARIKTMTMNHFSPKLRPPDSRHHIKVSKWNQWSYSFTDKKSSMLSNATSSDELVESGEIFYFIFCGYFPLWGWKVSGGRWLGRKMTPGTRDGDNQKEELSHSWHGDTLPSTIRWLLFECMLNEQNILFVLGIKKWIVNIFESKCKMLNNFLR